MDPSDERKKLEELCVSYGASSSQASVMAKQLQKRAGQLAEQRGISRIEAMKGLLELLISGREGNVAPGFDSKNSEKTDTDT